MIYYTRWKRLQNKLTGLSCSKIEDFPGSYSKILLGSARYFLVSTFLSGGPHSFLPGSNTHISMKEAICRSSCWSNSCAGGSQTNNFCFSYPALTCQASPSLDRCPWPSAGGGTPSAAVGGPATATAPGSRRCPSGSWRAACRCVSWVQGVTWWRWTGFGHLLHSGERHRRLETGWGNETTNELERLFSRNAHRCWWWRTWHCMCQNSRHLQGKEQKTVTIKLL